MMKLVSFKKVDFFSKSWVIKRASDFTKKQKEIKKNRKSEVLRDEAPTFRGFRVFAMF